MLGLIVIQLVSICQYHFYSSCADYTDGKVENEEEYRKALETCERCLQLFAACLENNLVSPPPDFVDRVMSGLPENNTFKEKRIVWAWSWLHFAAAACITVILVHFGFFDYISRLPGELQVIDQFFITDYHINSLLDRIKIF